MEVVDFDRELRRAALEVEEIASDDVNARMDFATNLLREVTPVDTGFARSRWRNNKSVFRIGGQITNDAPYITYLNQGGSKQAPAFFIERVLQTSKLI